MVTFEPGVSVMTSGLGLLGLVTPGVGPDLALTRMSFPLVLTETLLLPGLMFTSPARSFSFFTPGGASMRLVFILDGLRVWSANSMPAHRRPVALPRMPLAPPSAWSGARPAHFADLSGKA